MFYVEQDKTWRNTLEDECRATIQLARERNQTQPEFLNGAAEAGCELVLLLADGKPTPASANAAAVRIAALYRDAAQRGTSPGEYATVREDMEFVRALVAVAAGNTDLLNALATLDAAL